MTVSFTVFGEPMSKGSLTAIVRGGKARMIPGGSFANRKGMQAWRRAVEFAGTSVMDTGGRAPFSPILDPLDGPLEVSVAFYWSRPKNETREQRKREWKTTPCDIDKALRALLDPLKGIVIADDARVVRVVAEKRYVPYAEPRSDALPDACWQRPRAEVTVTKL